MTGDITSKYPLDFDALAPGTILTQETLEKICGVKSGDVQTYQLAILGLKSMIEKRTEFTVQIVKYDMHVLSWEDAVGYNIKRTQHHVNGIRRRGKKQAQVPAEELSLEVRRQLELSRMRTGFLLSAVRKAVRLTLPGTETKQIAEKKSA